MRGTLRFFTVSRACKFGGRARRAELEVSFTKEKSRVDVMQAVWFRQLRSPCGISRSSDEPSRAFQRESNWTGRGEPLYSTGRALSAARPVAAHRGLLAEVPGLAGARRRGGRKSVHPMNLVAADVSPLHHFIGKVRAYGDVSQADRRHQPGEGRGRHPDAAGDRGRPARLHPAPGLGDPGFQRRGGTRAVAAAA
jgi:hypothetical protein